MCAETLWNAGHLFILSFLLLYHISPTYSKSWTSLSILNSGFDNLFKSRVFIWLHAYSINTLFKRTRLYKKHWKRKSHLFPTATNWKHLLFSLPTNLQLAPSMGNDMQFFSISVVTFIRSSHIPLFPIHESLRDFFVLICIIVTDRSLFKVVNMRDRKIWIWFSRTYFHCLNGREFFCFIFPLFQWFWNIEYSAWIKYFKTYAGKVCFYLLRRIKCLKS